jgi:hypothetical protein
MLPKSYFNLPSCFYPIVARMGQKTAAFQKRYKARAGIEGTLSQAVCVGGL